MGAELLHRWVIQAEIDAGDRGGQTSKEAAKIRRLKTENKRLLEDVPVLKTATTLFAAELDSRNR